MAHRKKHLVKTITWRIIATLITFSVVWTTTGELKLGVLVGGLDALIKMFAYYYHERAWYHYEERVQSKAT